MPPAARIAATVSLGPLDPDVVDHDRRPLGGEHAGDAGPDVLAGAGHQRHLAGQFEHVRPSIGAVDRRGPLAVGATLPPGPRTGGRGTSEWPMAALDPAPPAAFGPESRAVAEATLRQAFVAATLAMPSEDMETAVHTLWITLEAMLVDHVLPGPSASAPGSRCRPPPTGGGWSTWPSPTRSCSAGAS